MRGHHVPWGAERRLLKHIVNHTQKTGMPGCRAAPQDWVVPASNINPRLFLRYMTFDPVVLDVGKHKDPDEYSATYTLDRMFTLGTNDWSAHMFLNETHMLVRMFIDGDLEAYDNDMVVMKMEFA